MKTIWKFPLQVTDSQEINIPIGAEILSLQMQAGVPCIWAQVDPDEDTYLMKIVMFGTGHAIPHNDRLLHLGTFQLHGGSLVFHAFQQLAAA